MKYRGDIKTHIYTVCICLAIMFVVATIVSVNGNGQVYQPELVVEKIKPGMTLKECLGLLGIDASTVSDKDIESYEISHPGVGAFIYPQHEITLFLKNGKLVNMHVKWHHLVEESEYLVWAN